MSILKQKMKLAIEEHASVRQNGHAGKPSAGAAVRLITTPLVGKRVRPVKYLAPGRIPLGKLILCAGRGGDGKSTLWRSIAADVSAGRCVLGLQYDNPIRAKVLIVAAEDGPEDTILPGLLAEGADLTQVAILEGVQRGNAKIGFTLAPDHIALVRQHLSRTPDIKLVIIDPIASFIGRARIDDHRASELRLLLDPLSELAESSGVTVVMIAHLNKSSGDAVDRIAGSAAYRDTVRAAYLVCQDPDDNARRLLMPIKDNLPGFMRSAIPFSLVPLPEDELRDLTAREEFRHLDADDLVEVQSQLRRLRFDAPLAVDPNEAMKAKKPNETKVERCRQWLLTFLTVFSFPDHEIIQAAVKAGFTADNVKEAKTRLRTHTPPLCSKKRGFGVAVWWNWIGDKGLALPDRTEAALCELLGDAPHTPENPENERLCA